MRQKIVAISIVVAVGAIRLAAAIYSDVNQKQPWEWTAAERATALRDPAQRLERVRASQQELRRSRLASNAFSQPPGDVIDGAAHPELYFPTQLFEHLVRVAFTGMPPGAYWYVVRQRSGLFENKADWDRFAQIAEPYASVLKKERAAANTVDNRSVLVLQPAKCRAEALAFRTARSVFGKTAFDRMLYKTVAPTMSTIFSSDTDFEKSIGKRLETEERCQ